MPKRTDLESIMIIGSGPIVIGQACEFDYSGSQACKALRQEGYRVILVNSNPATIMTDPEMADRTYVEPITPEVVARIIERERPDALLPTLGGQTGLNVAVDVYQMGVLEQYGVELIGASYEAIQKAEDRDLFKQAMARIGLEVPKSKHVNTVAGALAFAEEVSYPVIVRPSYTLGGTGGGIAYNQEELEEMAEKGLDASPIHRILVEESVLGWKEYELEVMRDRMDNVVIVCSIENFDPMGVHTGDSITVAPAQTLSDLEYQKMRDAAIRIIREIGVDTGGSNIQFAINPDDGRMVVIEMNPRVSRSSALASKATGFPIAKIAAKLAVGYTLDEIPNDITKETPACFEPTIDYCVVKFPRWDFAKFPTADQTLTSQMKSVGEVMAIGRTFKEALQKALRSLEQERYGLGADGKDRYSPTQLRSGGEDLEQEIRPKLLKPNPERIFFLRYALLAGISIEQLYEWTKIDRWFLYNLKQLIDLEEELRQKLTSKCDQGTGQVDPARVLAALDRETLLRAKRYGYSDRQLAHMAGVGEDQVREYRLGLGIKPVYKLVDTCAAEFQAYTPYYYSTYETEDEAEPSDRKKVMVLGGGPNRIGQGIEFDYCCVQAAFAASNLGYEVIMVNCNPETVSTDYDISDRLYFEPLTLEDVLHICDHEKPDGIILQFGGQTPLKLALALEKAGMPILGTSPSCIDQAEDRERFSALLSELGLRQPPNGIGRSPEDARKIAARIGYPVLVRPSYVLGGRAMEVVYSEEDLERYMAGAVDVAPEHPVLVDKFLESAIEVDVDAVSDGENTAVVGIMEHIEEAGVHSGDSACSLPPYTLSEECIDEIRRQTKLLAQALRVVGLLNVQFAVKGDQIFVLEVNPRASRTVPFVSKATGIPLAQIATKVMLGQKLPDLMDLSPCLPTKTVAVKEAVFPFLKFPGVEILLGPEMRSTGEVMGLDENFGMAFAKSQMAAGVPLPLEGTVLLTVADRDKPGLEAVARDLKKLGFRLLATTGTRAYLENAGIPVDPVFKVSEGRPDIVDHIKNGDIDLIINTPIGRGPKFDEYHVRRQAIISGVPVITTIAGARAAVEGIKRLRQEDLKVRCLQEIHAEAGLGPGEGERAG